MKVWSMGVGGWMPAHGRQTHCTMIETKKQLILVDGGTGISQLMEHEHLLSFYEEVDLILTHYHMDHIMGLFFLPKFFRNKRLTIWGPTSPHYEPSCEEILRRYFERPFATTGLETLAKTVICKDYSSGEFSIGGVSVRAHEQPHTLPSYGLTFDNLFRIATDTNIIPDNFTNDVKLLFHECWAQKENQAGEHTSFESLMGMVKNLKDIPVGLIHRNPSYSDTVYEKWISAPLFLPKNNQCFSL